MSKPKEAVEKKRPQESRSLSARSNGGKTVRARSNGRINPSEEGKKVAESQGPVAAGYLGKLNRHWYRRCLDVLGKHLAGVGTSPSIEQLQDLCDHTITSFLISVTGQAPDSNRPQFPADRAYYIPFEGDRAEKFNSAKPFYQLLKQPANFPQEVEHSVWSFFPWEDLMRQIGGSSRAITVDIASEKSLENQQTIAFERLLGDQLLDVEEKRAERANVSENGSNVLMRKSLLLRGADSQAVRRVFSGSPEDTNSLRRDVESAIVLIFEIYRSVPGKAAVEILLLYHFQILQWLWQLCRSAPQIEREVLSQQDKDYKDLFQLLLEAYFLGNDKSQPSARREELLKLLGGWVEKIAAKNGSASQIPIEELVESLRIPNTPFSRSVDARMTKSAGASIVETAGARRQDYYAQEFNDVLPHLRSFHDHFLRADIEGRLERDISAFQDDPRRSGDVKQSFVWVCADFDDLDASLPLALQGDQEQKAKYSQLQPLLSKINGPYRTFFRKLETLSISDYEQTLSNYWRTRGDAARSDLIYASFASPSNGIALPPSAPESAVDPRLLDPRPQNIFLRVRICDSVNEPMIDGLFVFTRDHDERVFKAKDDSERREDVEDLLAFAKVFFFIVRDHLHGLDRARDSADIGRLNQHLYDRRLADLDSRMNRRIATEEFKRNGPTNKKNWEKFVYEVLNNFAYSLLEKPDEVRNETFPYDRLLIIPIRESSTTDSEKLEKYSLPFYLFQALYVECRDQKIDGGHYSLLKPFQSPVEDLDSGAGSAEGRFRARSFQEVSQSSDGKLLKLQEYLQKHYVSAWEPPASLAEEPASYVVKSVSEPDDPDRGKRWAGTASLGFWSKTKDDTKLWCDFLVDLTESYQILLSKRTLTTSDRVLRQWFLLRFALLRAVLSCLEQPTNRSDVALLKIGTAYRKELQLRFEDNKALDVLDLAIRDGDPLVVLTERKILPENQAQIEFVDYLLRNQDPWTLAFLRQLTNQITGEDSSWDMNASVTWYQDLLTRPVEETRDFSKHQKAANCIGKRTPPYEKIQAGQDAISAFLGFITLTVGQGTLERRQLRCVVAMMRDYDDTKTGRVLDKREAERRLAVDRNDLTLYTRTFFQNVHRLLTTARERQQVMMLSTDITQIARSWYSSGADRVVAALNSRLESLVAGSQAPDLGRLRPELVDGLFDSLLGVLTHSEKRRDSENIDLESFPFDRVIHVPLLFGPTEAARWCYARTTPVGSAPQASDTAQSPSEKLYDWIRSSGRHAVLGHGGKALVRGTPLHLSPGDFGGKTETTFAKTQEKVLKSLKNLARPALLDRFIRRLNKANAIQTLALAGTLFHLSKAFHDSGERKVGTGMGSLARELRDVLERNIRSLERYEEHTSIFTDSHMDRASYFHYSKPENMWEPSTSSDVKSLLFYPNLFEAIEGSDWRYGIRNNAPSKLFYVYYSVPAPDGFIEREELDSRYRGVFCLIVDDATTDDKTAADQSEDETILSDAEAADQDDIRTFIHNVMSSFRLVLIQQALQHRIHKPGVEQDLIGMLHRLKNELAIPLWNVYPIRAAIQSPSSWTAPEQIEQRQKDLLSKLKTVESTISGVGELFASMKKISDLQQEHIPLQVVSSEWIAWSFLDDLVRAILLASSNGNLDGALVISRLEELAAEAKHQLGILDQATEEADGRNLGPDAVEAVQKRLADLAAILDDLCSQIVDPAVRVRFTFGFEVHTVDEPLKVQASHLFAEALKTLVENAFQALWSYTQTQIREQKSQITTRLRLVCRPSATQTDEVLLDFRNSSSEIPKKQLDEMNADPPRTLSNQMHSELSGKRGGSGFGHYFARRIVSEYCGGSQAARRLDVKIEYDRRKREARTLVQLLRPIEAGYATVSLKDVATSLENIFKDATNKSRHTAAAERGIQHYYTSKAFPLQSLLSLIRQLPAVDYDQIVEKLASALRLSVSESLRKRTQSLRQDLIRQIQTALPSMAELSGRLAELGDPTICRRGSLHELNEFLKSWFSRHHDSFIKMIDSLKNSPGEGARIELRWHLERIQRGEDLLPEEILSKQQLDQFAGTLRTFAPYLWSKINEEGLKFFLGSLETFEKDQYNEGIPIPVKRHVLTAFRAARWDYAIVPTISDVEINIRVYYLPSTETPIAVANNSRGREMTAQDLRREYTDKKMVGRIIAQYWDALRETVSPDGTSVGNLQVIRYVPQTDSSKEIPRWEVKLTLKRADVGPKGSSPDA